MNIEKQIICNINFNMNTIQNRLASQVFKNKSNCYYLK